MEVPCTLTFVGPSQEIHKVRNLISLAPTKTVEPTPSKKSKLQVVSEESSDSDEEAQWLTFRGCLSINSDKEAIVSNSFLNDRHINFAQFLLQQQFPAAEG